MGLGGGGPSSWVPRRSPFPSLVCVSYKTQRPSSSCVAEDAECEAGNGFRRKKGKCCQALGRSPSPRLPICSRRVCGLPLPPVGFEGRSAAPSSPFALHATPPRSSTLWEDLGDLGPLQLILVGSGSVSSFPLFFFSLSTGFRLKDSKIVKIKLNH